MLLGLWWLIERRRLGRQFRAVAEDPEIAAAFGIDANRVSRRAVVLGIDAGRRRRRPVRAGNRDFTGNGSGRDAQCVCGGDPGWLRQRQRDDFRRPADRDGTVIAAVYVSNAYSSSIAFVLLVMTLIFFPFGLVPERASENV